MTTPYVCNPKKKKNEKGMENIMINKLITKIQKTNADSLVGKECPVTEDICNLRSHGQVKVNGEVELQRGKKLHAGDCFDFDGNSVQVCAKSEN